MDIREIPLNQIVLDPRLNLRDRLDDDTVSRYAEAWTRLPPITVYQIKNRFFLADGFHRHAAAVQLGRRTIPAEIRPGSFEEALDFVAGANLFHGLPLTRAERRRAIEVKLRLHHDWSDRHLAEELCVGRELVAKIRRQLVEGGQIPAGDTRLGADGKIYPALPREAPARPRREEEEEPEGAESPMPRPPKTAAAKEAPWEEPAKTPTLTREMADAKALALQPPATPAAPTIDEMLEIMTRQVMEVVQWTHAEGFTENYKLASPNARGLFHAAALKLAARSEQLRKIA
jgi:ParB-like chromosome segregation protein Spo0J